MEDIIIFRDYKSTESVFEAIQHLEMAKFLNAQGKKYEDMGRETAVRTDIYNALKNRKQLTNKAKTTKS